MPWQTAGCASVVRALLLGLEDKAVGRVEPFSEGQGYRLYLGDCVEAMRSMPEDSVDAVACDPPYGLEFMGKEWDRLIHKHTDHSLKSEGRTALKFQTSTPRYQAGKIAQEWHEAWAREALRVLKPGGFLLAFGGTRTVHRLTCAIEDAGFEIRDSITWLYGQGFPKSLDVSKAIDKMAGAEREIVGKHPAPLTKSDTGRYQWNANGEGRTETDLTTPATEAAKQWEGWGTALKPAHEPIVVARKPLSEKSVARNVLEHGTGALNIDGSRVSTADTNFARPAEKPGCHEGWDRPWKADEQSRTRRQEALNVAAEKASSLGRWPANVLLSHVSAVVEEIFHAPECDVLSPSSANCVAHCPVHLAGEDARIDADGRAWIEVVPGCQRVGVKRVRGHKGGDTVAPYASPITWNTSNTPGGPRTGHTDPDGFEEVEAFECVEGCPVRLLDEQSGTSKDNGHFPKSRTANQIYGNGNGTSLEQAGGERHLKDQGGASRFFKTFEGEQDERVGREARALDNNANDGGLGSSDSRSAVSAAFDSELEGGPGFFYCAKSSRSERNSFTKSLPRTKNQRKRYQQDRSGRWLARVINKHPTVKPLGLMRYLVKLVTPPSGVVLDPFMGSGTTGVACVQEGFAFIGIEKEPEYFEIGKRRVALKPSVVNLATKRATNADTETHERFTGTLF